MADYYRHAAIVAHGSGRLSPARDYAAYAAELWTALGVEPEARRCRSLLKRWGKVHVPFAWGIEVL